MKINEQKLTLFLTLLRKQHALTVYMVWRGWSNSIVAEHEQSTSEV